MKRENNINQKQILHSSSLGWEVSATNILKPLLTLTIADLLALVKRINSESVDVFVYQKDIIQYKLRIRNEASKIKLSNVRTITKWRAVNLNVHNCKAATIARAVKIEPSD